jgi:NADH-ubiquinone oxidoreductase chain 1
VIVSYVLIIVGVLVGVAFLVLFERKVLGYVQVRRGPNRVGYTGILQSLGDAIKLFIKEQFSGIISNKVVYFVAPVVSLFLVLMLWIVLPYESLFLSFGLGGLFFFACTGFGVYPLIGRGWASNSNYALLGSLRGVAQTISYEVRMALIFLSLIFLVGSYMFNQVVLAQSDV